jgi:hypothetical protein
LHNISEDEITKELNCKPLCDTMSAKEAINLAGITTIGEGETSPPLESLFGRSRGCRQPLLAASEEESLASSSTSLRHRLIIHG